MKRHEFTITLAGYGDTPDKSWQDAVEEFCSDPGPTPEEYTTTEDIEE